MRFASQRPSLVRALHPTPSPSSYHPIPIPIPIPNPWSPSHLPQSTLHASTLHTPIYPNSLCMHPRRAHMLCMHPISCSACSCLFGQVCCSRSTDRYSCVRSDEIGGQGGTPPQRPSPSHPTPSHLIPSQPTSSHFIPTDPTSSPTPDPTSHPLLGGEAAYVKNWPALLRPRGLTAGRQPHMGVDHGLEPRVGPCRRKSACK